MFGFVTFVYPETVKLILSKGNPHFVCDARVLVKPYKEKGKVPDKYRHSLTLFFFVSLLLMHYHFTSITISAFLIFSSHFTCRKQPQMDRGDFSPCGTPTGLDARDPFDLQLGKFNLFLIYIFILSS